MITIKDNEMGQVKIADEVVAIIAGTAALEADGVVGMSGNITGDIVELLGKKNFGKGVKVEIDGNNVSISISLLVKFGYKIADVVLEVQSKVQSAVENMTGLVTSRININVSGIYFDKDKQK